MFHEVISYSESSKEHFLENVRDDFGNAMGKEVYSKMIYEERALQSAHEDARAKMAQIERITAELRTLI